jgi:hypothetical protein
MQKRPLELLLLVAALAVNGTLGLVNVFFLSKPPAGTVIALTITYGFIHPFLAYALLSMWRHALKITRPLMMIFLVFSFFFYQILDPVILILNSVIYLYALFYLYRPDVKTVFGED